VEERTIKVRLAEIDTPERGQPWASRAKQALSDKVFGEEIEVRVVTVDRYGRTVGHVWIGDRHINREMIREGHAWVYRQYLEDKTMLDDEAIARESKVGLWGLPESQRVPPWDWRRGKREAKPKPESVPDQTFTCGTKRKCGEMGTCAEARFYLEKCGLKRLDGDKDGVPCESLCQ
jgi:endonuclease YncB( thermonuclease family)